MVLATPCLWSLALRGASIVRGSCHASVVTERGEGLGRTREGSERSSSPGLLFEPGALPGVGRIRVDRVLGQKVGKPLAPSVWALLVQDCGSSRERWVSQSWRGKG